MREYWREKLNDGANACYALILNGLRKRNEIIDCKGALQNDISESYFAVYKDHPELFYMSNSPYITQKETKVVGLFSSSSLSTSVRSTSIYDKKTIDSCNLEIDKIVAKLACKKSDLDIVLHCLDYIVLNTEYGVDNQLNQNAASVLCFHRAQCSGIAKALKLLLDRINVFCIVVEGSASNTANEMGPHAWNIVCVNGTYYHVDATYMLGANIEKRLPLYRKYVFYDDKMMSKTHSWDYDSVPRCIDPDIYPTLNGFGKDIFGANTTIACFNTLYEFKTSFREKIRAKKSSMKFRMSIPVTDLQELRRLITSSCDMVISSESIVLAYYFRITDDRIVTLTISYS